MEKQKENRGRKPVSDPKVCIRLYISSSVVVKNGGESILKLYLTQRAENRAKNMK